MKLITRNQNHIQPDTILSVFFKEWRELGPSPQQFQIQTVAIDTEDSSNNL